MKSDGFDLNDIQHEPTDAQLEALMESVASKVNRRARQAESVLMQRLHDAILAVKAADD